MFNYILKSDWLAANETHPPRIMLIAAEGTMRAIAIHHHSLIFLTRDIKGKKKVMKENLTE